MKKWQQVDGDEHNLKSTDACDCLCLCSRLLIKLFNFYFANMAKKVWDFECPQYVDFEKELDNSGKSDIFFESTFYEEELRYIQCQSETKINWRRCAGVKRHAVEVNLEEDAKEKSAERRNLNTPNVEGKERGLTDSDENKLLGKMTAALSLLTPKLQKTASRRKLYPDTAWRRKLYPDTASRRKVYPDSVFKTQATKSTIKPNTVPASRPRSRKSKSLDHLNKIISGKTNTKCGMRKSSSLNDLKAHKRLKHPVTPMCLKRTIFKAKEKIARKTTEEMELEQIAKLQKQLKEHLRQNEISLKRLNLRPRQCAVPKVQPKTNNFKDIKGAGSHAEKSNVAEKELRRTIALMGQSGVKKETSKPGAVIKSENVSHEKSENLICPGKPKAHSVCEVKTDAKVPALHYPSARKEASKADATTCNSEAAASRNMVYFSKAKSLCVSAAVLDATSSSAQKTKKLVHKKIIEHSGLFFIPSVKPLLFEEKNKEKPQAAGAKHKETSASNLKDSCDKENKGAIRPPVSYKKSQGIQSAKCDIAKLNEPCKITGKRTANPLRGTPLAENISRN